MPSWLVCRAQIGLKRRWAALCLTFAVAALTTFHVPARADDLAGFNAALEEFASHNRVALGYLRTGADDLAAIELERTKAAWDKVVKTYGATPPAALKGNPQFNPTLTSVRKHIADALVLANSGKTGADMEGRARRSLQRIREELSALRKASKVTVLADCILDANGAMAALFALEKAGPDYAKTDLAKRANTLGAVIKRCDRIADADTRKNPEFRRLIDGTLNSLTFIPKVIANKDREMLTRVIGELRAFDNLLAFRFG